MTASSVDQTFSTSWQTQFYTDAAAMSEARKGICEVDEKTISLRAGRESVNFSFSDITDITVGEPPEQFADEFDEVFGIRFTQTETPRVCFIRYNEEHADIFEYQLFAEIVNGARGVAELGAVRGGQQTGVGSDQIKVAVDPDRVVFKRQSGTTAEVSLGDVVNIQSGTRTVNEARRKTIKIDHMENKKRVTSYLSLIEGRIQNLLNRYLRKEYAKLKREIGETDISRPETELVIGYYTTHDLEQTMQTLTGGDKYEFESIYEQALEHGLVTDPDDGVGLTQKGKMLANIEIEMVNK